jgi:hypothetical protein
MEVSRTVDDVLSEKRLPGSMGLSHLKWSYSIRRSERYASGWCGLGIVPKRSYCMNVPGPKTPSPSFGLGDQGSEVIIARSRAPLLHTRRLFLLCLGGAV